MNNLSLIDYLKTQKRKTIFALSNVIFFKCPNILRANLQSIHVRNAYANALSVPYYPCVVYLATFSFFFRVHVGKYTKVPWMRHGCLLRQETASHKKLDALCLRCRASNFNHQSPRVDDFFSDANIVASKREVLVVVVASDF